MYNYYKNLADNIKGPLMLYNIKATTHMSIPVEIIRRLSMHPNIVGLKDSERDLERMEACISISKGREDFAYFCGWAAQSAHSLELGADGIVPSTGIPYLSVRSSLPLTLISSMSRRITYRAARTAPAANPIRHFLV